MSDQPWDFTSGTAPTYETYEPFPGSTRPIWRPDDPVYWEADLPPGGYDQIITSDAPIRVRIWQTDDGRVRFRIGRWGDMGDRKLRDPDER